MILNTKKKKSKKLVNVNLANIFHLVCQEIYWQVAEILLDIGPKREPMTKWSFHIILVLAGNLDILADI